MNRLQSIKDELLNALRKANYISVFTKAKAILSSSSESYQAWFLLEIRYNALQKDYIDGLINLDKKEPELRKISQALLSLINALNEDALINKTEELPITKGAQETQGTQETAPAIVKNKTRPDTPEEQVQRIVRSEIVRLIEQLNSVGIKSMVHYTDLLGFGNYGKELLDFIRRYTVLNNPDDIRRILHWQLTAQRKGAPLSNIKPEAAQALHKALFGQQFLLNEWAKGESITVVLFRRGKNGKELTNLLKTLPFINLQIIVSATDEGESWYYPARLLSAPGIPGIAKALVDLSEDRMIKEFMETRIHLVNKDGSALAPELIQNKIRTLIQYLKQPKAGVSLGPEVNVLYQKAMKIESDKRKQIAELLLLLSDTFEKTFKQRGKLSYQSLAVRNLVLLGSVLKFRAQLKNENDQKTDPRKLAIKELAQILNIRPGSSVLLPNDKPHFLLAARADGTIYFSEVSINYYIPDAPIIGLWLVNELVDEEYIRSFISHLKANGVTHISPVSQENIAQLPIPEKFRQQVSETLLKVDPSDLDKVFDLISSQATNYSEKGKVPENLLTQEVKSAIDNAQIIITTNKRIETNSGGALLIPGMDQQIAKAKAIKIHLALIENAPGFQNQPQKHLEDTYRYITNNHYHKVPEVDWKDVGRYFDYVLIGAAQRSSYYPLCAASETIERETDGQTAPIVIDTSQNQEYGFYGSTVLINAILSIYQCHLSNYSIGNGGSLVPFSIPKSSEAAILSMGFFRNKPACRDIIEKLKRSLRDESFLHYQGAFAFDIDMTILPKGAKTLGDYPELAYLFMRLLRQGVKVAIISGNSMEQQMKRVHEPIKREMQGERSAFERLIFYVDGGSTKITFDQEGQPNLDHAFNEQNNLSIKQLQSLLNPLLVESANNRFDLNEAELEAFMEVADKKYKFQLLAPWKDGKDWEPPWVTPAELEALTDRDQMIFPWVEIRGQKNEDATSALAIKPLPKLPTVDIRLVLQMKIRTLLEAKINAFVGIGGSTTIDISGGKTSSMKDLRDSLNLKDENIYYFGDEFTEVKVPVERPSGKTYTTVRGNDLELELDESLNINTLAVNPIHFDLEHTRTIWIGRGPQAVYEFLETLLIEPEECI